MKIAVDFDGVILDSERLQKFYADYFSFFKLHKKRLRNDVTEQENCFDWTREETHEFYRTYFTMITEDSTFMPGASIMLNKLKQEGHEICLVSLRGSYADYEVPIAEKRLDEFGFKFDKLFWGIKDKSVTCEENGFDVMIEDNPENVEKFVGKDKIKVIYLKDKFLKNVDALNVFEAGDWFEIYQTINNLK